MLLFVVFTKTFVNAVDCNIYVYKPCMPCCLTLIQRFCILVTSTRGNIYICKCQCNAASHCSLYHDILNCWMSHLKYRIIFIFSSCYNLWITKQSQQRMGPSEVFAIGLCSEKSNISLSRAFHMPKVLSKIWDLKWVLYWHS